ncbi:hypothetical protein NM688_g6233 [Phlebia brevispora]|uniref:Uncharacterized protein n=1 Tax=Phlebia brevispora TaxID=194682 RepID=A0ACC1SIE2_9APHY|nr:hypothetical protein NM688_g6233 [Phlebia brevispora]
MVQKALLSLLVLAVYSAYAAEIRHVRSSRAPSSSPVELPAAPFVVSLTDKVPRSSAKKQALRELRGRASSSQTATIAGSDDDEEYLTSITVGGHNFTAIVDTGSSDTWLAQVGFSCFSLDSTPIPAADCFFGSAGFDPSTSKSFVSFPDTNFNISYGDGEFLTGAVGFDTVTIGGLTVTHQEIGLVTHAAWEGDTVSSGLIGLAYPGLTSVYNGSNPDLDGANNSLLYNPFFFSAVQEKAVKEPFFSVALNRGSFAEETNSTLDPNLGFLAFGGIAPVEVTKTSVTVPVQGFETTSGTSGFFFYAVDVDSWVFPGSNKRHTAGSVILDTGTTLNYVPTQIAAEFNSKFKPPATFDEDEDTYFVDCDATAPAFSATIGGVEFTVDPKDQILPFLDDTGNVVCISGTQDGGPAEADNIFILGDTFLHNVVATFNIAENNITISERVAY